MKAGDIVKRDGTEYLVIGKTFGSKEKLADLATVLVEAEQANLERDEDGNLLALTLWAPEVMGAAEGKPESLETVVARARKHEPVAYLVGWKEFYSMRFKVTADVLVPRPETEVLVSEAVAHLRSLRRPGRMWDACTGSGCVAIAAAKHVPDVSVLATDVSPAAVELAAGHAAAHGLAGRVRCRVADLLEVPEDCQDWRRVDFLSANPPYVADGEAVGEAVRHEPAVAVFAGGDGLEKIRPLIGSAGELLVAGGKLAMEFGQGQADAVRGLLAATGAFEEPRIVRDHQGMDRTAVASRRG